MGRPRSPAKRRGRGDARRRPKRTRRGAALDAERIVGALAARGRAGITAVRLLRMLGGERNELRALRRLLRQLESEGRVERSEGNWRVPRADGFVEAGMIAGARARDALGREQRLDSAGEANPATP